MERGKEKKGKMEQGIGTEGTAGGGSKVNGTAVREDGGTARREYHSGWNSTPDAREGTEKRIMIIRSSNAHVRLGGNTK